MKSYNHNRKLISELYGQNFDLMSLLNENKEKKAKDLRIVQGVKKRIAGFQDARAVAKLPDDPLLGAVTGLDGIETDDEGFLAGTEEEVINNAVAGIMKGVGAAGSGEAYANKIQKGGKVKSAATKTSPQQSTKATGPIAEIQRIIDPEETITKTDGQWGRKSDEAFTKWVIGNIEVVKKKGLTQEQVDANSSAAGKLAVLYFNDESKNTINGVLEFCKAIQEAAAAPLDPPSETDPITPPEEQTPAEIEDSATGDWAKNRVQSLKDFFEKYGKGSAFKQKLGAEAEAVKMEFGNLLKGEGVPVDLAFTYEEFKTRFPDAGKEGFRYLVQIHNVSASTMWFDALSAGGGNERTIEKLTNFGTETIAIGGAYKGKSKDVPTAINVIYYNEETKTILYDTMFGDYILGDVVIDDNRLKYRPKPKDPAAVNENNSIYGESRGSLYRKRYYGRY